MTVVGIQQFLGHCNLRGTLSCFGRDAPSLQCTWHSHSSLLNSQRTSFCCPSGSSSHHSHFLPVHSPTRSTGAHTYTDTYACGALDSTWKPPHEGAHSQLASNCLNQKKKALSVKSVNSSKHNMELLNYIYNTHNIIFIERNMFLCLHEQTHPYTNRYRGWFIFSFSQITGLHYQITVPNYKTESILNKKSVILPTNCPKHPF